MGIHVDYFLFLNIVKDDHLKRIANLIPFSILQFGLFINSLSRCPDAYHRSPSGDWEYVK